MQAPPVAPRRPHSVVVGRVDGEDRGDGALMDPPQVLSDDLFWLRDDARENAEVLELLRQENAYTKAQTAPYSGTADSLYAELRSRLRETDAELPYREGPWWRYSRTVEGLAYPLHCRVPAAEGCSAVALLDQLLQAARVPGEEVLLDENELATVYGSSSSSSSSSSSAEEAPEGQEGSGGACSSCDVGGLQVSPDGSLLCFSLDTSGSEVYALRIRRLGCAPGAAIGATLLPDELVGADGSDFAWGALGQAAGGSGESSAPTTLFYLTKNAVQRPYRVWVHALGTPQSADVLVYEEADEKFFVDICRSASGDYLVIDSASKTTSEVRVVPLTAGAEAAILAAGAARRPATPPCLVVEPRREGVLYSVDHYRAPISSSSSAAAGGGGGASTGSEASSSKRARIASSGGDVFVVLTNADGATNFKVCVAPTSSPAAAHWVELLPHSPERYITSVTPRAHFWAVCGREEGFQCIWTAPGRAVDAALDLVLSTGASSSGSGASAARLQLFQRIPALHPVFVLEDLEHHNLEWPAEAFRFVYSGPTVPTMVCEWRPAAGSALPGPPCWGTASPAPGAQPPPGADLAVLKQKAVPGVDLAAYATVRLEAPAGDGQRVPISLLYRPSAHARAAPAGAGAGGAAAAPIAAPAPLLLYAYGAYGLSEDPFFSMPALSLADRGVVFAIAHIRGGGEKGRAWYYAGKLTHKKQSFTDYIACAEHLVAQGWSAPGKMVAEGGSAGGLLMGVVANDRPELWAGVLMGVPFLDVLVTMCDSSIPLVSTEWDEWGNPNVAEHFQYMASYDPVRRLGARAYPPLMLTAGLHDTRVGYWEPLKYVQRQRAANAGTATTLFKCELEEGHTGAMDRYKGLKDRAFELAWVLQCIK